MFESCAGSFSDQECDNFRLVQSTRRIPPRHLPIFSERHPPVNMGSHLKPMFVEAGVPMDWCVNPSETKINLGSSSMMVETKTIGITNQVSYMYIIYLIIWVLNI
jgi:hypothetical protein